MARRPRRAGAAPASAAEDARVRALRAAEVADDKRAEDVVVLDMRALTTVTDFFVICTGTNRVQMRAVADAVDEALYEGRPRPPREGDERAQWILLDYGDVVVHVFGPEARAFYRLERLWGDAPVVERRAAR